MKLKACSLAMALCAMSAAHAQDLAGMVEVPCSAPPEPTPALRDLLVEIFIEPGEMTPADLERLERDPDLAALNAARRQLAAGDWAELCRYDVANDRVRARHPAPRVVFIGDSITENWVLADPELFSNGIVGRGIGGQTTPQILLRFRADVIDLKPRIVHILAGTNDVAGNTGPTSPQQFRNNIMSMVEIAKASDIDVILGSIPPADRFFWNPAFHPGSRIAELNVWLRDYATEQQIGFVDYYSALAGPAGGLRPDLGNDGVHPNRRGYDVMRQLVEPILTDPAE